MKKKHKPGASHLSSYFFAFVKLAKFCFPHFDKWRIERQDDCRRMAENKSSFWR